MFISSGGRIHRADTKGIGNVHDIEGVREKGQHKSHTLYGYVIDHRICRIYMLPLFRIDHEQCLASIPMNPVEFEPLPEDEPSVQGWCWRLKVTLKLYTNTKTRNSGLR